MNIYYMNMACSVFNILHGISPLFLTMMLRKVWLLFSVASKSWTRDSAQALDNLSMVSVFWDDPVMKCWLLIQGGSLLKVLGATERVPRDCPHMRTLHKCTHPIRTHLMILCQLNVSVWPSFIFSYSAYVSLFHILLYISTINCCLTLCYVWSRKIQLTVPGKDSHCMKDDGKEHKDAHLWAPSP